MGLSERILDALKAKSASRERNHQVGLGPSEYGHCREYVRNVMIGSPRQPADIWPAAAEIGTLIGDYLESAVAEHMGARTQVPVTTTLPNGLTISGTADVVLVEENALVDCKTKDNLAVIRRDGPSVENMIQVSIYTLGLVQAGVLTEGATAHLVYVDRSGTEQTLYEVEMEWDTILSWIDRCVDRLDEVLVAQEHIDNGEVEWARELRDKTPPYCYNERVMCPFRDLCWQGSEWVPSDEPITGDEADLVRKFVAARDEQREAEALRKAYREALIGVSGLTDDGYSVTWPGNGKALYVTKVKS